VLGDPSRLEQVIVNLLENALKYSPDGGTIHVSLERRGDLALLGVRDPGIGIPPDQQLHLFERYFRARNASTASYGGLGLGLYICHDIVERHGGRIWVESDVGHGSTFYVALPTLKDTQVPREHPVGPPLH
jgi:signal transduction histidine kinase